MADVAAAFDQQADDRDGVGDVEQDDARRDHAVERRVAPQIQQSQHRHDEAADEVRAERDVDAGIDVAQEVRKGKAAVAREGPAQAALPRVTGNQAPDARGYDETLEHDGARFAPQGLIEQCQDGHEGGRGLEIGEVADAEELGDGEEPRRDEAYGDGAHDGDGNHFLGVVDFLGEVGRTVETSKGVIGVDEADDESDPIR